LKLSAR